ncbi:MOSC N-terminal beta barrel domain-containing protein [Saccharothrix sp. AJ9571]|nr:MOSC N-terminal beta barrel domain-containing protein [Saccharothrix sp. AJ9571]
MAEIVELYRYPIKGCAGTRLAAADLTPAGIVADRGFMVIDEAGVFRSQRRSPRLAVIRPRLGDDGIRLDLAAPDVEDLATPVRVDGERRPVTLFGQPFTGIDQGDTVAAWLSEVLGERSRLVRVPPEHHRVTDGLTPGTSGYADSSALLVVSRASLARLHEAAAERGVEAVPMNRFRPNIVIDGWSSPHTEDQVRRMTAGGAELGYAKLATRCVVVGVDQRTGVRSAREPLRTLATYRHVAGGGVVFGSKFAVIRPGPLAVGDTVVVSAWARTDRRRKQA